MAAASVAADIVVGCGASVGFVFSHLSTGGKSFSIPLSTVNPGIFFARRFRLSAMEGFRLAMDIVVRVDDVLHCGTCTNAMTCTRMVAVAINR